jgi:hypothetical protein
MVIGEQIKEKLFQFLPELPHDISNTKYHKWKYSQVCSSNNSSEFIRLSFNLGYSTVSG